MALPKDHWIHAALSKEEKRMSKKSEKPLGNKKSSDQLGGWKLGPAGGDAKYKATMKSIGKGSEEE